MPLTSEVRQRRESRGLTVEAAARLAGISARQWRRLEAGEGDPSRETRHRVSVALGASQDALWPTPGIGSHLRRLHRQGDPWDHAQIVGQDGGRIIIAPLAHGSPKAIDPLALRHDYGVDLNPPAPADEVSGWKVLADRMRTRRRPARAPTPEEVFAAAAKP
jgi:transcriptional regulator with XRE-family HTH domain